MKESTKIYSFLFAFGLVFILLQAPFLKADPDIHISESRGANTDEGLNTCQIRNFVNHGELTLDKSDNFVKTPLFGAVLYLPFKIFGTKLIVGRLLVLIVSLVLGLLVFARSNYHLLFGFFTVFIVFCEYYLFHFFHYCLPEILSTVLILLSLFVGVGKSESRSVLKTSIISAALTSLAYFIKIQFFYAVFILPIAIAVGIITDTKSRRQMIQKLMYTGAFLVAFLIIYYIAWYKPNKQLFDYVLVNQTANRFIQLSDLFSHLKFVIKHIFLNKYFVYFTLAFGVLFIYGVINYFKNPSSQFKLLFVVITSWLVVESHKLFMTYLPTRYFISLFFAMGLLMALVLTELLYFKKGYKPFFGKVLSVIIILILLIINGLDYSSSLQNRTYAISEINDYLSTYEFKDKRVVGAWAPSLCWESRAVSYPVWKGYFNDKNTIEVHCPAVIIAETDEQDSGQVFLSQGINIDDYADSIRYFTIHNWKIKVLWIKPVANQ